MSYSGKIAVVTGAGSGIGKALATALVAQGATVILADLDEKAVNSVAEDLGSGAAAMQLNVRDVEAVESFARDAWEMHGGVDYVFANAGIAPSLPMLESSAAMFDVLYEVNVRGSWATCTAFARLMAGSNRPGALCVTGSEHSMGVPHLGAGLYTASKHAVLGWADVMRSELPETIRLSVLCPGVVNTNLYDATRNTELPAASQEALVFGKAVMEQGMGPAEVAEICLKGVADGAFVIPTHASSRHVARQRFDALMEGFNRYAPEGAPSEQYAMDAVIAAALKQTGS